MLLDKESELYHVKEFIERREIIAIDTETTGLNTRNDRIIGIGISDQTSGVYITLAKFNNTVGLLESTDISVESIQRILTQLQAKKLIMFNASFDARMIKSNFGIDLVPVLYCDVLLLKHTCNEDFPLDLKGIGASLFGSDVKAEKEAMKESIKASGGTASEFYKADPVLLGKYCIQDCLLTYRIFNYYSVLLKKEGLESFFYEKEVMPLCREVTIPMESTGVKLDTELMKSDLAAIKEDISEIENRIYSAIDPLLTEFEIWFLNKEFPLTTAKGNPTKVGREAASLGALEAQREAYAKTGAGHIFNLQSKIHLKKLFFEKLTCMPLSTTPTGLPQVDEEFLESVAPQYPWVQELITLNKLIKIKSTYIERMLEESEDSIFYPAFKQHGTVSGRYSGDIQQLPRPIEDSGIVSKYNNNIRKYIIARQDSVLISCDYNQLEPTIFAHVSGDPALQKIFNDGLDFYSEVAIRTEKLVNVSSDKKAPNYLGKVNKAARQKAKAYALGIAYGMTGYKLHFEIGTDIPTAEQLVKDYLSGFPELDSWIKTSHSKVQSLGKISSQAGRVRHMPQARRIWAEHGARILEPRYRYAFKDFDDAKFEKLQSDYAVLKNCLNNAVNFQIQSLAASIVSCSSIVLARKFKQLNLKAKIIMSIHDEIVVECDKNETEIVSALMKQVMENIVKLSVPLTTEPKAGQNFFETK
jgi:DNA polymerase-1